MTLPVGTLRLPLWVPVFAPQATAIIRSTPNAIEIAITDFLMPLPPTSRRELGSSAPAHECARARSQLQRSRKKTHYDLVGIRSEARGDECKRVASQRVDHASDRYVPAALWKITNHAHRPDKLGLITVTVVRTVHHWLETFPLSGSSAHNIVEPMRIRQSGLS